MATREERRAEFTTDGSPPAGVPVQLLCEDHRGTYVLPFACIRTEAGWHNATTRDCIEVTVLGWQANERSDL